MRMPLEAAEFDALEYTADDAFRRAHFRFARLAGGGWRVEREGRVLLELGEGYRLLRTRSCGVCSTDLDRRFLPFPLPQVIGHEIVAEDASGRRYVVEINASHAARGVASQCPFCRVGLDRHCPDRLVLGIHDLPGGFGPFVLAPERALVAIPDAVPDATAALVEPFAAALRAVTRLDPGGGARVAVLGLGRLGLLTIAALGAWRRATGQSFAIEALARTPQSFERAVALGADRTTIVTADPWPAETLADVVIDTTGSPAGFDLACALATREVHLKSTHGQPTAGVAHLTEAVVDEFSIMGVNGLHSRSLDVALAELEPLCHRDHLCVGWLGDASPPPASDTVPVEWMHAKSALDLLDIAEARFASDAHQILPRVDAVVVDDVIGLDAAIRPNALRAASPVRPTGALWVHTKTKADAESRGPAHATGTLALAIDRGLRISTSRCGDFGAAVELLVADTELRQLGDVMISHRFGPFDLSNAFACARSPQGLKVLIDHPDRGGVSGAALVTADVSSST